MCLINIYWVWTLILALCFRLRWLVVRLSLGLPIVVLAYGFSGKGCEGLGIKVTDTVQFKPRVNSEVIHTKYKCVGYFWVCQWSENPNKAKRVLCYCSWGILNPHRSAFVLNSRVEEFHLQDQKTIGKWGKRIVGTNNEVADKDQSLNKTCSVEMNQYFIC